MCSRRKRKKKGLGVADEADEVLEPSFQTRRIASCIVAKVALLAFQPKPCRRLNVLSADRKGGSIATLGALPRRVRGCDEEIEVIPGHCPTRDQHGSLPRRLSQDVADLEPSSAEDTGRDLFKKSLRRSEVGESDVELEVLQVVRRLHPKRWIAVCVGLCPGADTALRNAMKVIQNERLLIF
jgi:hypothetical protein